MKSLKELIKNIPTEPGVYLHKDAQGHIMYIGKAKNLKNRVRSYFNKSADLTHSKRVMVSAIADIETIITNTETEALILESTLIKRHRPEYNVDLKDDKYFLYIKITADEYPTLETVRRIGQDRSRYFGPYASARAVRTTLKTLKDIFHYRTCKPGQERPCFDYTIGRCAGPCVNAVGPRQYKVIIDSIASFLRGNIQPVLNDVEARMAKAAKSKQFESAAQLRDQRTAIHKLRAAQKVVAPKKTFQDIISIARRDGLAAINLFNIRDGALLAKKNFMLERAGELSDAQLVGEFMTRYYPLTTDWPKEIIIPERPTEASWVKALTGARIAVPLKGNKKKLLAMGATNAHDWLLRSEQADSKRQQQAWQALKELGAALHIPSLQRIEIYDISNIQGVNAVGSMVVFVDGLPSKNDYRKFNIRTVKGANDPAMLAEVLSRRFSSEKLASMLWPDLILLDGGKGQLSVVDKILPARAKKIPMIALAKRLEEIYRREASTPLRLRPDTDSYFLIQRMRDEAHRFAIGSHRQRHKASAIHSRLDDVPGVGPKIRQKLLKVFGSVDGILNATPQDLKKVVNNNIAKNIYEHLS